MHDQLKNLARAKRLGLAFFVVVLLAFWGGITVGSTGRKEVCSHIKASLAKTTKLAVLNGI